MPRRRLWDVPPPLPMNRRARVLRLHDDGLIPYLIARELHCGVQEVRVILNQAGLSRPKPVPPPEPVPVEPPAPPKVRPPMGHKAIDALSWAEFLGSGPDDPPGDTTPRGRRCNRTLKVVRAGPRHNGKAMWVSVG